MTSRSSRGGATASDYLTMEEEEEEEGGVGWELDTCGGVVVEEVEPARKRG